MANIQSAKKRIKTAAVRTERNKAIKSRVKTELKKFDAIVEAGDKSAAEAQLLTTVSYIDKAETKGVFHKKTASRKISNLTKSVNKMA